MKSTGFYMLEQNMSLFLAGLGSYFGDHNKPFKC